MKQRTLVAVVVVIVMVGALFAIVTKKGGDARRVTTPSATVTSSEIAAPLPSAAPHATIVAAPIAAEASDGTLVSASWGSGRGELGHERPQEGNAEGPMSLALSGGRLVVLDQINGRMVRYGADGRVESVADAPRTAQDVAVAKDGTSVLLDRLSSKSLTVVDPSGRKVAELPLQNSKVGDPGLLTGVVVDGKDVYVEKEHGALVLVGTTDGRPADEATELAGRPTRDGTLLLHAAITQGRVALNAIDRKSGTMRFARAIPFAPPLRGIVLLDSDARGTIYLGADAGGPDDAQIVCLDPTDGRVLGRVTVPTSDVPEESFRDFTVGDDGTIVVAVRSDQGVAYRAARCP